MGNNANLIVAAILVIGFLVFRSLTNKKASAAVVRAKIEGGASIIDVRSPGEFSSGSYPKARNIPLDSLASRLGDLPKGKAIVVFCASGSRSAQAAKLLRKSGFQDVVNAGGLASMPR
jgi:phage shock protein E